MFWKTIFILVYLILYSVLGWALYAAITRALKKWKVTYKVALVVRLAVVLLIASVFLYSAVKIWRKDISPSLTSKALVQEFTPDIVKKLLLAAGAVKEKPTLEIHLRRLEGHLIDLAGEKTEWTQAELESKYQYLLLVSNKSPSDLESLSLDFQFPFFVESHKVLSSEKMSGVAVRPNFTQWSASASLNVKLHGKPRPMNFSLAVHNASPGGRVEILFVFDRRTPSVRQVLPFGSDMARTLPRGKCEFITGQFKYCDEVFEVFRPFETQENGTFQLGSPKERIPEDIVKVFSLW